MSDLLQLPLVVGKSYRTRGGWRAKVVADDLSGGDTILVVHYHSNGRTESEMHYPNGRWMKTGGHGLDLIAEWVDPPKLLECWVVFTESCTSGMKFSSEYAAMLWLGTETEGTKIVHMREVAGE